MAGLATRSNGEHLVDRFDHDLAVLVAGGAAGIVAEAEVLGGVFRVPGDLLGQGVLGVEMEVAVQAVFLEGHVLHQADAVPQAPPLAGIDVVNVHPHALVQRQRLGHHRRRVVAALAAHGPQQFDAGDEAFVAIDAEGGAAVIGIFLQNFGGC